MNALPVRRPLGCLKTALRRTWQTRATQRSYATSPSAEAAKEIQVPSSIMKHRQYTARNTKEGYKLFTPPVKKKLPYALYPPLPPPPKDPLPPWTASSIARLDPTGARTALFSKARPDRAKVGDVLMVTSRKGETFAGAFMQIRRAGVDTAIQLRGNLMKVGVEMWFKVYSPAVMGIDIIWRRPKTARRARLTYLRKKKHDMGSVDDLVFAWKKERARLRTSKRGGYLGTIFEPKA